MNDLRGIYGGLQRSYDEAVTVLGTARKQGYDIRKIAFSGAKTETEKKIYEMLCVIGYLSTVMPEASDRACKELREKRKREENGGRNPGHVV